MADNGSAQSQDTKMWPLPSFHFKVTLGSVGEISFSEVSGLETEFEEITYRAGDSNDFTKLKMPGLKKVSDITLKKGIFVSDSQLWKWIGNVNMNIIQRESMSHISCNSLAFATLMPGRRSKVERFKADLLTQ